LYRLPGCFLCYQPPVDAPRVSQTPAVNAGFITFGSFNNLPKVTPEVISLWAQVLSKVPSSRLLLKSMSCADENVCERIKRDFQEHGIDPARIQTLPMTEDIKSHLALYSGIDIALDTFPYNGTTTTCEALWMGVPVVTLAGDRHAGRVGFSVLNCLGLSELVAVTPDEYVEITTLLAHDETCRLNLRKTLRKLMRRSPLMNANKFARGIENAYREIW